jgi:hypothetical protein
MSCYDQDIGARTGIQEVGVELKTKRKKKA